ncbi:MAG: hypothetical protein EBT83_09190, partial [Betaproteobacteria bacterium]|nr:hypothetical protein [Betaproteobacteria bacterium]
MQHWRVLANASPLLSAWIAFATYSMIAALFVQFVVLPEWLPGMHAGFGLLANSDAVGYHQIAADFAARMNAGSWWDWVPTPDGQSAAGLAAPFYAAFGPRPWVLIPVNASLHATAGALVIALLRLTGMRWRFAIAGGTLWVIMPSSLQWVAQIQKDGYFFAGMLASLLAWTKLLALAVGYHHGKCGWGPLMRSTALLAAGIACVALSRVYGVLLLQI